METYKNNMCWYACKNMVSVKYRFPQSAGNVLLTKCYLRNVSMQIAANCNFLFQDAAEMVGMLAKAKHATVLRTRCLFLTPK